MGFDTSNKCRNIKACGKSTYFSSFVYNYLFLGEEVHQISIK